MCFQIPLADGRVVYMKKPESNLYSVVWVSSEKFLTIWDKKQKNDINTTLKKYKGVEDIFNQSIIYHVDYIYGGIVNFKRGLSPKYISFMIQKFPLWLRETIYSILPTCKIFRFDDGITRASWLINNGAQSFPIACSPAQALELTRFAGA